MLPLLMLLLILLFLAIGVPIAFTLGLTAVIFIMYYSDITLELIIQQLYLGTNSFPLLAIPLFMLAGALMNHGGISVRLINFALAIIGMVRGGLGMVNVVASVFFGAITGTAAGASAAVGQIMIPAMKEKGYSPSFAAAVTSAGSSLGIIIPPSVPMILYGSISGLSVASLFLTGVPIGIAIAIGYMIVVYIISTKKKYDFKENPFSWNLVFKTFISALPALLVPVAIMGGILTGFATPTESAAIAVLCGIIAGLIYKQLTWSSFIKALNESVVNTALVMLIVATAKILGFSFSSLGIGRMMLEPIMGFTDNTIMLMLIASLILFIGGFIFDGTVMVLVIVPLFLPLVQATSIDPMQFAMVVIIVWAIGQQTPPVASGLYITTAIAKVSMLQVSRYNVWFILVLFIALIGMIFFPDVMLYIPRLMI
ncbi:TRAP transporter large permease [Rossellomorea aquimaris]|jgi:tripartite ATP-independent transporter DctM subunit|uniref:TRAP transporter large permease n=1 Tax=Rossellomorea aquimaris TaxID=189382 RepID=A0A5D4UNH3_9BACI|nr:TRAP transporter large permease [Rossellomorea aquimaris]TYS81827.1 TRAP transporter large permease [Rossellomorea aquimaris]TYS88451.1 TRAP transporter large permease [Rossellomorea aquimaris]TYS89864.1 TRAP transporter large permease [Rossellomorea aquimaris]